jgi:hypothetical protein
MVLVADGEAFCDHVLAWDSEQSDQHYDVYMCISLFVMEDVDERSSRATGAPLPTTARRR